ncbi:MAG: hypothetical protein EPN33_12085 [Acidobacteria bacterium]|nr:MAG: hypothetical protein EPN33_12085 [Acidobacteriota bacterium]
MKFTASLQRVLQLRRSLERQEEMKLSRLAARRQAITAAEAGNRAEARSEQSALLRDLSSEVSGAELQLAGLRHEIEAERAVRLRLEAVQAERAQLQQQLVLLHRTRERETLDTLEAHCREAERRERLRRDQAALDEAFLLRRHDRQHEEG